MEVVEKTLQRGFENSVIHVVFGDSLKALQILFSPRIPQSDLQLFRVVVGNRVCVEETGGIPTAAVVGAGDGVVAGGFRVLVGSASFPPLPPALVAANTPPTATATTTTRPIATKARR